MNTQHNEKGFTLIELIVVIAIMGIVAAVLVPQFTTLTLRSRMSTDLTTVKTVQDQANFYYADRGTWPGGDAVTMGTSDQVIESLITHSYIDTKFVTGSLLNFQTEGASLKVNGTQLRLELSTDDYNKFKDGQDKDNWLASH